MNIKLLKYISKAFFYSENNKKFIRFTRIVSIIGVALGSIALLVPLAVLDGFHYELRQKAAEFSSHVTLRSFRKAPIENVSQTIKRIKSDEKDIKLIFPVIQQGAIIKSSKTVDGILLRSTGTKEALNLYSKYATAGKFDFTSPGSKEIILSRTIAEKLNVGLGSNVIVYSISTEQLKNNRFPSIESFKVKAIYSSGMGQFDGSVCFIPYQTAASFFNIPQDNATDIEIMLNNIENSAAVSARLEKKLGFPIYGLTVFDTHSAIFNWIDLQREPIPLVLGLIGLVAVFNIISTLLILVLDKTNSIGILRTIGLKSNQIRYIFIHHGIMLALKGLIIGCGLTLIVSLLQKYTGFITMDPDVYYLDSVPVDIQLWHYALVISLTLIFSGLASAVPAWAASHISPIKAIRYK